MLPDTLSPDLVGTEFEPLQLEWSKKDVMLYALGVGAGPERELDFVYEGRGPAVLPTYAVIPGMRAMGNLRQAVRLKVQRLLHGEQDIELLRPLPAAATITLHSRIAEVWDKGKAGVIGVTGMAEDDDGPLFRTRSTLFYLGGGGFGGEPGPSTRDKNRPPERAPDLVIEDHPRPEQGALYRLSGDRVALHIDPEFARAAGYEKPFMHGLCTYGFVGRAALAALCGGDASRFRSLEGRFAERAEFDEPVISRFWRTGPGEAVVQADNGAGKVLLSQARVVFRPGDEAST